MTGIKQWLKMTDQIVKENSYFGQRGVNEICPKMEKLKNFYKSSSFDFSILFNDRYSKGNEKDFLYFLG